MNENSKWNKDNYLEKLTQVKRVYEKLDQCASFIRTQIKGVQKWQILKERCLSKIKGMKKGNQITKKLII